MSVGHIALRLVGVGPMLMHSCRLADPLDPVARAISTITSKRLKTDADYERIAELEWHGGLWLFRGQPCLPPHTLKRVFVDGAKLRRKGAIAKAAFRAEGPALLQYDGPRTLPELYADERFRYRDMVRVHDALTARTRPCFPEWSAQVRATFLPSMINQREIVDYFKMAGPYGIGDFRPTFGRFLVEELRSE
ncbi:hypothetical protein QU42_19505 [Bradyrhizobium sp. UASWS1016]|jgi:hypothetical protein|uniref:hypothetical protein n=1 Tax=Bradyrhizobium sp. UASWS1016 TaxID=1566379 RepID=UPI000855C6CD|nr:hypothetical protein [Bradyrhizobium sp. UASWS1016]OCX29124.1 hypothetical protein QU42_19505 [Bradyrhizobium sp. UASWS1016]